MAVSQTILSGLAAMLAYGTVRLLAGDSQASPDILSVPWDKFLGVGSAGLAFGVGMYFIQREDKLRLAYERMMAEHMAQHKETTQAITNTFAETVKTILADARADSDRREQRLIDLLQGDEP